MLKTLLALLDFRSPYHVGWRTPEPVIEGLTVHRALVYASSITEGVSTEDVAELRVSAALPALRCGSCYKLLLPLPPIPSRVALKKLRLMWITMRAANLFARLSSQRLPHIRSAGGGRLTVDFDGTSELCYEGEVVRDCSEGVEVSARLLERVDIFLNRMDRATNAADVYRVSGFRPRVKLGVVLQGSSGLVDCVLKLLRILGELGIGGMRSRGFGRFSVETGELCDQELLSEKRGPGQLVLLGSYVFNELVDPSKSVVIRKLVEGLAGPPYDSYTLPYFNYIGAGSVVRATDELRREVVNVRGSHIGAVIIFNPVVLGGVG